jgi:hypothetical protein
MPVPNLDYVVRPIEQTALACRRLQRPGVKMSFEAITLLLNWLEMGVLLAILFRLSSTFQLIASTQRELRRAIHHLGQPHVAELGITNALDGPGNALDPPSPHAPGHAERTIGRHQWPACQLGSIL